MKKTLLAVILLVAICIPVFAAVNYSKDGLTVDVLAQINLKQNASKVEIGNIQFVGRAEKSFDVFKAIGQVIYTHSAVDAEKSLRFAGALTYTSGSNLSVFDAHIDFDKTSGSYKPSKLLARVADTNQLGDISLGDKIWWDQYDSKRLKSLGDYANPYPNNYLGYIYSFDKDPAKSGVIAGFATSLPVNSIIYKASANAIFHKINNKIEVENGNFKVEMSTSVGSAALNPFVEYRYSYLNGPDMNGLYLNLTDAKLAFADVSVKVDFSLLTSIHKVDGKLKFMINEFGGYSNTPVTTSVSGDLAGATLQIAAIRYENYPAYKPEENGFFADLKTNVWYKPFGVAEKAKTGDEGPLEPLKLTYDAFATIHIGTQDGAIKSNVQNLIITF